MNTNTSSSEWCIAPKTGLYEINSSLHGILTEEADHWDGQILANVMIHSDDRIIPTVKCTMVVGHTTLDDGHNISISADYRTSVYLERGEEVWVDYIIDLIGADVELINAPLEIICDGDAITPLTQRVEAAMEDELELCDVGEVTLTAGEGLPVTYALINPDEINMLRIFGQDDDGNQTETVAINCKTGAVTINADNKNIEEDAKDFWRAVVTVFSGLFESDIIEEASTPDHEAYDRAMGVFKDNG